MRAISLSAVVFLSACGGATGPSLQGQVLDAWGTPLADATVLIDGQATRLTTDSDGLFSMPLPEGRVLLKAGKEGYIQEHLEVELTAGETPPRPMIKLFPKPEENGLYVVGTHEYLRLEPQGVHWVGNDIANVQGLKSVGQVETAPDVEIIFHTDLREDELARIDLELRALTFVPTKVLAGPVGDEEVKLNMYVAGKAHKFDVEPLRSKKDFRLWAQGLEDGSYAFHMNHLLDAKDYDSFARNPEALRVAFPFTVR